MMQTDEAHPTPLSSNDGHNDEVSAPTTTSVIARRVWFFALVVVAVGVGVSSIFLWVGLKGAREQEESDFARELVSSIQVAWDDYQVVGLFIYTDCRGNTTAPIALVTLSGAFARARPLMTCTRPSNIRASPCRPFVGPSMPRIKIEWIWKPNHERTIKTGQTLTTRALQALSKIPTVLEESQSSPVLQPTITTAHIIVHPTRALI